MKRLSAFTLVEAILYLALFNIVFFSVITFTITLTQNNRSAEYKNAVEKNAIFVIEHLKDTFNQGSTIDEASSTFGNNNGKVRITTAGGYRDYSVTSGTFLVQNGTTSHNLTDSLVDVTMFLVEPVYDANNVAVGARITMTLVAEKYPDTISKTIQSYYAFR